MQHYSLIILFVCLIKLCSGQNPHITENPKELGKQVFSALQNYDLSMYQQLIVLDTDCMEIMNENNDSITEEFISKLIQRSQKTINNSEFVFSQILKEIYLHEIDLLQTSITQIRYTIKANESIETTDIHLVLRYQKQEFRIIIEDCIKSDSWLILGGILVEF